MMEALILAGGLIARGDWRLLALAAGAVWVPLPSAVALAAAAVVGRKAEVRHRAGSDVRFAETVVGELRAGASLRASLRVACADLPEAARIVRRLDVGRPLPEAVQGLAPLVPSIGHLVETAIVVGGGGGRMLPVFEELMVHAAAADAAAAELRTATAPVKASMLVLVGAPVAYLVWSLATGRLARLLALPGGLWLAVAGMALFGVGVAAMLVLWRRGR